MPAELLKEYDYSFPPELIAQEPARPRDSARLLVYNRATERASFDVFKNLPTYLPKGAILVCNETKVIPARIEVGKESGGRVRLLYVGTRGTALEVLSDRKLAPGSKLSISPKLFFTVVARTGNSWFVRPSFPMSRLYRVLTTHGTAPLPPYIKHSPLTDAAARNEYQAVFAHTPGSVAAPTASLHFTKELLRNLARAGIQIAYVTLHVNLGTFAPVTEEQMRTGKLHTEHYEISAKTAKLLARAKKEGRPIIAVGTTVLRTLESAYGGRARPSKLQRRRGTTELFIREGYRFKFVNGLITNFHIPRSSLLMLVAALAGRAKILSLYKKAVAARFRLFSFGDAMLIL